MGLLLSELLLGYFSSNWNVVSICWLFGLFFGHFHMSTSMWMAHPSHIAHLDFLGFC